MKFKLLEKATHPDQSGIHVLLEAGTEIGDGTPYPIRKGVDHQRTKMLQAQAAKVAKAKGQKDAPVVDPVPWFVPGPHMEPLDEEARKAMETMPNALTLNDMPVNMMEMPSPNQTAKGF